MCISLVVFAFAIDGYTVERLRFTRCAQRQRKHDMIPIGSFCASLSHQNNFQWNSPIERLL